MFSSIFLHYVSLGHDQLDGTRNALLR